MLVVFFFFLGQGAVLNVERLSPLRFQALHKNELTDLQAEYSNKHKQRLEKTTVSSPHRLLFFLKMMLFGGGFKHTKNKAVVKLILSIFCTICEI